jgi:tetratricopeptide (TPR) repeat protein
MVGQPTSNEEAQLAQTIEMFEVITQSQPQDYQSLEILKEAYAKLGREGDVVNTSKRIANAYVLMGQLSSAILEYESILQRYPDDPDALAALGEIESKANSLNTAPPLAEAAEAAETLPKPAKPSKAKAGGSRLQQVDVTDDGRQSLHKIFVDGKIITNANFELCWATPEARPGHVGEPFIQVLANKGFTEIEKSLRILSDKARLGYLPLEKYDIDMELARIFPAEICQRWCILPFDRLSKSILVATANPFNRQAAAELEAVAEQRLLWYLALPAEMTKILRKAYR